MESEWPTSMEISKRVLVKKAYHPNASSGTPGILPPRLVVKSIDVILI